MRENKSFEESLNRLEVITKTLSEGKISLEESMKLFEEGLILIKESDALLSKFEKDINALVEDYQGDKDA